MCIRKARWMSLEYKRTKVVLGCLPFPPTPFLLFLSEFGTCCASEIYPCIKLTQVIQALLLCQYISNKIKTLIHIMHAEPWPSVRINRDLGY